MIKKTVLINGKKALCNVPDSLLVTVSKAKQKKLERKERNKKDKEWSIAIRNMFDNKCAHCGSKIKLNACHIIPREIHQFRYDLENGIALCPRCHKFSYEWSAHHNPFAFHVWFMEYHPEQFLRLLNKWKLHEEFKGLEGSIKFKGNGVKGD